MGAGSIPSRPLEGKSVREFGARGDGGGDDAKAIQAALDSARGPVVIPRGEYRVGRTLLARSGTDIRAHPEARVFFADGAGTGEGSFLLTNGDREKGNEDISVEGGIWDGNCPGNPRGPDAPGGYTGVLIDFSRVRGLTLRNLTAKDAESYFIRLGEVGAFTVEGIGFRAPHVRPNQDGVHLGGFCEDGVIRSLEGAGTATPNDDMVAFNADDALHRVQNIGMKCGPIRRVRVSGLRADDCLTFIRFLSVWSPIEDVTVEDVRGGCQVYAVNMDAGRKCRSPLFDASDAKYAGGVGMLSRVHLRGFTVHRTRADIGAPLIDAMTRANEFTIRDFVRDEASDKDSGSDTLCVEEIPGFEVSLEGIDGRQGEALRRDSRGVEPAEEGGLLKARMASGSVLRLGAGGFRLLTIDAVH